MQFLFLGCKIESPFTTIENYFVSLSIVSSRQELKINNFKDPLTQRKSTNGGKGKLIRPVSRFNMRVWVARKNLLDRYPPLFHRISPGTGSQRKGKCQEGVLVPGWNRSEVEEMKSRVDAGGRKERADLGRRMWRGFCGQAQITIPASFIDQIQTQEKTVCLCEFCNNATLLNKSLQPIEIVEIRKLLAYNFAQI